MHRENGNGNGNSLAKRTEHVQEESGAAALMKLPPWLQSLKDAMAGSIQADDLKEIMSAQVQKAREGNMQAANFVLNQAHKMLQGEQKRVTVIQNNYYDG